MNLLDKFIMSAPASRHSKRSGSNAAPAHGSSVGAGSASPSAATGVGAGQQGVAQSASAPASAGQQVAAQASGAPASGGQQGVVPPGGNAQQSSVSAALDVERQSFEDRLAVARPGMAREQFVHSIVNAFMTMFPPTGARRARCLVDENALQPFSSATAEARSLAFASFLAQCPTANFSDFLVEIVDGSNPQFDWDCGSESEGSSDNSGSEGNGGSGSDSDDGNAGRRRSKRARRSSSPSNPALDPVPSPASSSSSSSSVACKFTFDDYVRMSRTPDDMLQPCVEVSCRVRRKDHEKQVSESSFKMPPRDAFPTFRDPKDKLMDDPFEFLIKLERQLKLHRVPLDRYGVILVSCLRDRLMQEWVETNIVSTCHTWEDMKTRFKEKYDDPEIKNRLMLQLEKCVQSFDERVYEYTERFQSLVVRISAGAPIDTQMNIIMCERGFIPELRSELAKFRSMKTQSLGRTFEFNSLSELYQAAATLECGLAPRAGRIKSTATDARSRKRTRRARVNNVEVASKPVSVPTPSVNKIEMTNGKPVNVNKKHRQRKSTGGGSSKGGRPGGSKPPGSTGSAASGASAGSSRNTGAPSGGAAGAAKPFTGTCFKCGKPGHRIADCRSH